MRPRAGDDNLLRLTRSPDDIIQEMAPQQRDGSLAVHDACVMPARADRRDALMMEAETAAFDAIGVCRDQRWLVL